MSANKQHKKQELLLLLENLPAGHTMRLTTPKVGMESKHCQITTCFLLKGDLLTRRQLHIHCPFQTFIDQSTQLVTQRAVTADVPHSESTHSIFLCLRRHRMPSQCRSPSLFAGVLITSLGSSSHLHRNTIYACCAHGIDQMIDLNYQFSQHHTRQSNNHVDLMGRLDPAYCREENP